MKLQTALTGAPHLDDEIQRILDAGGVAVVSCGAQGWTTYRVSSGTDGVTVTGSGRNDNEFWNWTDCEDRMRSEVQSRQQAADRFGSPAYKVFPRANG